MKLRQIVFFSLSLLLFFQCTVPDAGKLTSVELDIFADPGSAVYLIRVPYIDERNQIIDSVIARKDRDHFVFKVLREEDRIYEIRVKNAFWKFYFIADAPKISIVANSFNGQSVVTGSPASISLNKFHHDREITVRRMRSIQQKADSLVKNAGDTKRVALLQKQVRDSMALIRSEDLQYADTVGNPAAFLAVYNNIDFGDQNRQELKQFIQRNAGRFPKSQPVQKLKQEVMAMISIYEEEFNVGDSLPSIALPDGNGNLFSTASFAGKYYLIDFWSTWCRQCMVFDRYKKTVRTEIPAEKLGMVSVVLDDNKETWISLINRNRYNWPQLIDVKMWRGVAAQTLKFDSIPFNFLVSPKGIVIAKAIPADSLTTVLKRIIK